MTPRTGGGGFAPQAAKSTANPAIRAQWIVPRRIGNIKDDIVRDRGTGFLPSLTRSRGAL
jgi:hypothetical protein